MMRSPKFVAVAIRKPNGSIKVKTERFRSLSNIIPVFKLPILRGMIGIFEMLIVGTKALNFSARENLEETDAVSKKAKHSQFFENLFLFFTILFSLALGIFLFKFLPLALTQVLSNYFPLIDSRFWIFNITDGVIKTSFFILYVGLIGFFPDIKRVFEYHGAEHKSVFNYEVDLPLDVKNAKKQSRFHPRCGTSFILVVFLISIFIYTLMPNYPVFYIKFLQRIAILPVIAGISYEFLRLSARYADKTWVKILIAPGLMFQRMTTREPDESQLEVALCALRAVLELEKEPKDGVVKEPML
ncbi:DUF1385 domain-containing protein [Candidatus Peregrinibacteria bacterium]|nr:DUF1385 domain-containing protein [Candidatus Peregrinibacteria bacterium]